MTHLLIFGPGYTGQRIAAAFATRGWTIETVRSRATEGAIGIGDAADVRAAIGRASHIVSTVPPDPAIGDPVLSFADAFGDRWLGYLSSTGVYGDAGGAWVDESAPLRGRRGKRLKADAAWLALGARVFRLPGIYGPGRSALDRVTEGKAHRIDLPEQVFSRVHVDDIVGGVVAGIDAPSGAYNLADDHPAHQNAVIEAACALLGVSRPPLQTIDEAGLSPMARAFYAENRRVANGKAKRVLGWRPASPDFQAGLRALSTITSPAIVSPPATIDWPLQR